MYTVKNEVCLTQYNNAQQFKVAKTALNKAWNNMLINNDVKDYSAQ